MLVQFLLSDSVARPVLDVPTTSLSRSLLWALGGTRKDAWNGSKSQLAVALLREEVAVRPRIAGGSTLYVSVERGFGQTVPRRKPIARRVTGVGVKRGRTTT